MIIEFTAMHNLSGTDKDGLYDAGCTLDLDDKLAVPLIKNGIAREYKPQQEAPKA
jgi:hypothetical protein